MPSVEWYQTNHLFIGYCFILYLVLFYFFIPGSGNDLMFLHYGISVWLLSSQKLKHHTTVSRASKVFLTLSKSWQHFLNGLWFSIILQRQIFFLMKSRVHLPCADSLVFPWCKGPAGQGQEPRRRGWVCPSWVTAPTPPIIQRSTRGALAAQRSRKGKHEGMLLPPSQR